MTTLTGRPPAQPGRTSRRRKDTLFAMALLIPAFAIFVSVIFAPVVNGIITSFQDATIATLGQETWVGLANYRALFAEGEIFTYLGNTAYFVTGTVTVLVVVAMGLALLLNSAVPGRRVARTLYLIPWVVPSVVVALLWTWIFQPQYGILNYLLSAVGLVPEDQQWLSNPDLAMPAVIVAAIWRELPLMTLLLLAGLQGVPAPLLEAATVDGAGALRKFWHIILPSLRTTLATATLIAVISNFQSFTLIHTMTAGGPLTSTTTLSIGAFDAAFKTYDFGRGSAIGVLWLVVLVLVAVAFRWLADRTQAKEGR